MALAIGAHNAWPTGGTAIGATTYTTSALTTAATGSTFVIFIANSYGGAPSVTADTYNTPSNWHVLTPLTSGTNPVQPIAPSGAQIRTYILVNGAGGANHTLTLGGSANIQWLALVEIQGAGAVDQSVSTVVANAASISSPITPTSAGQLIVAYGVSMNQTTVNPGSGSGFTRLDGTSTSIGSGATAYMLNAAQATHDPGFTAGSANKGAFALSFPSSVPPIVPPTPPLTSKGAFTIRTT